MITTAIVITTLQMRRAQCYMMLYERRAADNRASGAIRRAAFCS